MKTPKYDFTQKSKSGKAGFEKLRHKGTKLYYFHFNDDEGQALLYSQGYASGKGRDEGMEAVARNIAHPERIERKKDGLYFFILKAGNHQEIGRSRHFEQEEEMEASIHFLQSCFSGREEEKEPPRPAAKVETDRPRGMPTVESSSGKHSFRLEFYLRGHNQPFRGRIENALTREWDSFDGLNMEAIRQFLARFLPIGQDAKQRSLKLEMLREKMTARVDLLEGGEIVRKNTLKTDAPVELRIEAGAAPEKGAAAEAEYDLQVYAQELGKGEELLIGEKHDKAIKGGYVRVPIRTSGLRPGAYRLTAVLNFRDAEAREEEQAYEGSRLVQVY